MAFDVEDAPGPVLDDASFRSIRGSRATFGRLGWGLADQVASSLTNFAIVLYVVRTVDADRFGAFSLAYVTYSFALSAARGLATSPLQVRFSAVELPVWRRAVATATGTATAVGLVGGVVLIGVALLMTGTERGAFLALGITLPGLMLQDSWRHCFFALGRGSQAFLNDFIWVVALFPALLVLRLTRTDNVFWLVMAWGLAATVGGLLGGFQARVVPDIPGTRRWLGEHRDLAYRYLLETTASPGATQLRSTAVGLMLGLAAVGYLQAVTTLVGPFMVIFYGITLVTVPEAVRVLRRAPDHLRRFCLLAGGLLAALGLLWGACLLVALPRGLGQLVLGSIWHHAYPLVLPMTLQVMAACLVTGPTAGLHALGAARRSLRAGVCGAAGYVVGGVVGAALGGVVGSVYGVATVTWMNVIQWWLELRAELKHRQLPAEGSGALSGASAET